MLRPRRLREPFFVPVRAPPPPAPAVIQGVLVPADAQVQEPQQANQLQELELS